MPDGVQARGPGAPITRRPRFTGCRPSTSLSGSTASNAAASSRPLGSGTWTRKASMAGSALKRLMTASTSAWVADPGRCSPKEAIPISAESLCLRRT